ncbi:MAG TPA: hypothetical protein VF134_07915 [Candidatus Dormibacteraeota bacterium]
MLVWNIEHGLTWGVTRLLGHRPEPPVAHRELEHAHWDPVERRWYTHRVEEPADQAA